MPKQSSSFGHVVIAFSDPACPEWAKGVEACSNGIRCPGAHRVEEQFLGKNLSFTAGGKTSHYAGYRYVTGRAGRTTRRDLHLCDACAAKFAKAHGLTIGVTTKEAAS